MHVAALVAAPAITSGHQYSYVNEGATQLQAIIASQLFLQPLHIKVTA